MYIYIIQFYFISLILNIYIGESGNYAGELHEE